MTPERKARHVYGAKAALTIEPMPNSKRDFQTVMLELAPIHGKQAMWDRKVSIQPTFQELPLLAALFLGYHTNLKLQRPGKWMEVEDQKMSVFIKGGDNNGVFALPVMPGDRVWVSALLLQEYSKNFPDMQPAYLIASLQTAKLSARASPPAEFQGRGGQVG